MPSVEDNNVLLKLVIRGMDPAEVKRLADQTYGQLKTDAAQHIEKLASFHRQKQHEMDEETKKRIDQQIKAETKALDNVTKLMRQQEVAANQAQNAWRRTMEDLENITVVAQGVWGAMQGGFDRFKAISEEVIKVTNIMNADRAGGSSLMSSLVGDITAMDLVQARNKAFLSDLQLTDGQFQTLAQSASSLGDALGTDATQGLNSLIEAMTTGRTRALAAMGVVVDEEKAYQKYAESIHKAVGALTDQEKIQGKQAAILDNLRHKLDEVGAGQETTAGNLERIFTGISNTWHRLLTDIGNSNVGAALADAFQGVQVPDALARMMRDEKWKSDDQVADEAEARLMATIAEGKRRPKKAASGNAGQSYEPFAVDGRSGHQATAGGLASYTGDLPGFGEADLDAAATADEYIKSRAAMDAADERRAVIMAKVAAEQEGLTGVTVNQDVAYAKLAETLGIHAEQLSHEERMQAIAAEAAGLTEEALVKVHEQAKKMEEELQATEDRAGFLSYFLFGPDGPEQTYEQMDEAMQKTVDNFGVMSDMLKAGGKKMTDALAKNLTAVISGNAAMRVSMRQVTHDVLESLAQQALVKAIYSTAEGFGFLASYQYPSAAASFAAAAAFAAVGVAAGLGARAVGNPGASAGGGASSYSGKGMSKEDSSSYTSGPRTLRGDEEEEEKSKSITVNMTVMPGGEAEAGRSVIRAIEAAEGQDGPRYARAS